MFTKTYNEHGHSNCVRYNVNGLSDQWAVEPMGCRTNGLSNQWAVGPQGSYRAHVLKD